MAGAFGAPLAGVMFSLEELHKFISSKLLICTFLASIASDFVGRRMFGMETAFNLVVNYPKKFKSIFSIWIIHFIWYNYCMFWKNIYNDFDKNSRYI